VTKKRNNAIILITVSFLFCFLSIGFALVNDELNVFGSLSWDLARSTILESGDVVNDAIIDVADGRAVTRIVVDTQENQQAALDAAGVKWNEGIEVQVADCSEIMMHYVDGTVYVLSKGDRDILVNPDSEGLFASLDTVEEIVLHNFDTANTRKMNEMFRGCTALRTIYAMKSFDVSSVTDSADMFAECYALYGGMGTYVYPNYPTESATNNGLDCTMARLDGEGGNKGYLTDSFHHFAAYFESNVLRAGGRDYTVEGTEATFVISNSTDSATHSQIALRYLLTVEIFKDGAWVEHTTEWRSMAANRMVTDELSVTPVTVDGVTYDRVRVTAACASGSLDALSAEFIFTYGEYNAEYSYGNGVIYLTLQTQDRGGEYSFAWVSGIAPDNSDPNLVFSNVESSALGLSGELNEYTAYQFCFFVTDTGLRAALESAADDEARLALRKNYVSVALTGEQN